MEKITIERDFLEHLLNCLANQKFISERPPNGDALSLGQEEYDSLQKKNQRVIDDAWEKGHELLATPQPIKQ